MGGGGGSGSDESAATVVVASKEWFLCAYAPEGLPTSDHLKLRTRSFSLAVDSIPDQHVVVQVLWISVDPYLRSKMTGIQDDGLNLGQCVLDEVHIRNIIILILLCGISCECFAGNTSICYWKDNSVQEQ